MFKNDFCAEQWLVKAKRNFDPNIIHCFSGLILLVFGFIGIWSYTYLALLVFDLIGIGSHWYSILLVFDLIGIWSYWYLVLLVFGLTGIWSYWYLVLLIFVLIGIWSYRHLVLLGRFSKEKHKFHGVDSPPGGHFWKKKPTCKTKNVTFWKWL